MNQTIKVAAAQFAVGTNVQDNLATCLRMLGEAAETGAQLVVLPEFCNHLSWYDGPEHCAEVSVELDGAFVSALRQRVRELGVHAVVNCTVRRKGAVTGTSLLFSPLGELLAASDKQVLIGHENDFLRPAQTVCPIVSTPVGRLGMYACMDGVVNETPRGLALRGAQILCNSLNSFALDEASLHIPVRAPENRVFVVAANKVGPLIPEAILEQVSQATEIPAHFLHGAGESQIVAPDGTVLARAPRTGEAVVVADIEPAHADDKRRPDGTDVFAARRPSLYAPISMDPAGQPASEPEGDESVGVAVARPAAAGAAAITEAADLVRAAARGGARLVVLPELFFLEGGAVEDPSWADARGVSAVSALAEACGDRCHVVTSLVATEGGAARHVGVVIGEGGVVGRQHQLHASARHAWAVPGDEVVVVRLPWGRVAVVVGDDGLYPETFRLLALAGAQVVAAPIRTLEAWEQQLGLVERSAENRVSVVAAASSGSIGGGGLITALQRDFTIMTPWADRTFDGLLSHPVVTRVSAAPGLTHATIAPRWAHNKVVSHRTDLLRGRPWRLADAITREDRSHD